MTGVLGLLLQDDLAQKQTLGPGRLTHGEFQVAGLLPDRSGQREGRFFKRTLPKPLVLDRGHLPPLLPVLARVDGDAGDLEVVGTLIGHHVGVL